MRRLMILLALGGSACGSGQQGPDFTELVLRGDAIASQIETSLAGAQGEFCCDRIGPNGKRSPGCFVQLGPAMGDRRFEFSLPDRVVDLGLAGQVNYRLQPTKLKAVHVRSADGEFILTADFSTSDVALKGSHSFLGDAVVPDIRMDRMRLVVHLKPVVYGGMVTYDSPKVQFTASVDNTFIPRFDILGNTIDVVDALTNYRRDLCQSIQSQLQKALDDPARKAALGQKIQEGISGQMLGNKSALVGLRFQGTDLVVRLRR